MHWDSLYDFLAMGRHGVYVWGSFAVMALCMIVEPLLLARGQRALVARLRRQLRAENSELSAGRRRAAAE